MQSLVGALSHIVAVVKFFLFFFNDMLQMGHPNYFLEVLSRVYIKLNNEQCSRSFLLVPSHYALVHMGAYLTLDIEMAKCFCFLFIFVILLFTCCLVCAFLVLWLCFIRSGEPIHGDVLELHNCWFKQWAWRFYRNLFFRTSWLIFAVLDFLIDQSLLPAKKRFSCSYISSTWVTVFERVVSRSLISHFHI